MKYKWSIWFSTKQNECKRICSINVIISKLTAGSN